MGGGGDLGDRPAPPRAVRGAGAGLRASPTSRGWSRPADAALYDLPRARGAVAAGPRRERGAPAGLHLPRRQGSDRPRRGLAQDGGALRGARLAGEERPLHRVPGRRPRRLGPGLQGRRSSCGRWRPSSAIRRRPRRRSRRRRRARRSRACSARASRASTRTSTSTARTARPTRWPPRARWPTALADWGPMVAAQVPGQGRPRGDRRRPRALRPGAGRRARRSTRSRATSRCRCPTRGRSGDRAFRAVVPDAQRPRPVRAGAGRAHARAASPG